LDLREGEEVTGRWRKLYNGYSYPSASISGVMKWRKMRYARYIACLGKMRNSAKLVTIIEGRDQLEDVSIDGSIILKWILEN
jgi:hypothetical protein